MAVFLLSLIIKKSKGEDIFILYRLMRGVHQRMIRRNQ